MVSGNIQDMFISNIDSVNNDLSLAVGFIN